MPNDDRNPDNGSQGGEENPSPLGLPQCTPASIPAADPQDEPADHQKPRLFIRIWRIHRKRQKRVSPPNVAEKITVFLILVTAAIGGVQAFIYHQQKQIMESSGGQTEQMIAVQKKIANLQYVAGSPNVRFLYFSLYFHQPSRQIWGYIRFKNFGAQFEAQSVGVAANLQFRDSPPNLRSDYNFADNWFQQTDPVPIPTNKIGSVRVGVTFAENYRLQAGMKLYSWGTIRYPDIGGEREERTFCRVIEDYFWKTDASLLNSYGPYPTEDVGGRGKECPLQ